MGDSTYFYNQRMQQQREAQNAANQFMIETGFKDQAAQDLNRALRNQIEQKASALGMSSQAAYGMAKGDLTNNSVLQDIWNRLKPTQLPGPDSYQSGNYRYTDPGDRGYFGMADYDELRSQNAPIEEFLKIALNSTFGVGPKAARRLGIRAYDAPEVSSNDLRYTDPGDKGFFGLADLQELAGQGATTSQLQDFARQAKYGVGAKAAYALGLQPTNFTPQMAAQREQTDAIMAQADAQYKAMMDGFEQQRKAAELQEKMRIKSQTTAAANMLRSQKAPNLQIQPASGTPDIAGTQGFKRRKNDPMMAGGSSLSALNIGSPSTLNI